MTIAFIALLVCMIIGVPIAFSLGIASLSFLVFSGVSLELIPTRMFTGLDSFPLMAVPFFILCGDLMNGCGITKKIIDFAYVLVGRITGGLGHATVVAEMFFSGISGSGVADCAAIGSIMIPAMQQKGYDKDFSCALVSATAVMGPLIPPSIPMVVYAMIAATSVPAMLLGGAIPGFLVGFGLMLVIYITAKIKKYPRAERMPSFRELVAVCIGAIVPATMPVIILGGMISGIFTATEAAGVAVVYALFIGVIVWRNLPAKEMIKIAIGAAKTTGIVFLVMATANIFNWLMVSEQVPQHVAAWILSLTNNPVMILFAINIMLLILGCFMEGTAAMILTVPMILTITNQLGLDPVFVGVVVVFNLMIGLITPPLGLCLYVTCSVGHTTLERLSKAIIPFLGAEIAVLFLVTYIPELALWLPRLLGYVK
jgi:tripartite ATP-independent transporter DctM subunit